MWDESYEAGHFGPQHGRLLIRNLRGVVTGRLGDQVREVETVLIENGRIIEFGGAADAADVVVDAQGAVAIPGLFDTHTHFAIGDFNPKQNAIGFIESYMHGGVTSMMSAGEVHFPGRPMDRDGVKAVAVAAARSFELNRPGGVRIHGGSLMTGPYMEESDYAELAAMGIWLMKVGFGGFDKPKDAVPHVRWAQEAGFLVMSHSGGASSVPGIAPITVDDLLAMDPDIAGHINGGTTSLPDADVERLVKESRAALQLVQAGNLSASLKIRELAAENDGLSRIILGSDTPSGTGVMPMAIIKTIAELSSIGRIDPTEVIAYATGNAGRVLRREEGILEEGRPADLVLLQEPTGGSQDHPLKSIARGDIPGIAGVIIDGQIRAQRSRNSPAPSRLITVRSSAA
ncbi:amidohydrolase family protein [Leucobacter tenebrionis]|uniref:amidohydrolase family protein n=1 Tax=Leucobacter tenebrionis TaxID=2873270 RepID=UPI001CA7ACCC|nr:amidohydrolase family protein [Leucobacter tenebrionis]QZY50680.1 amidohydrolase family protein [Leucobacter tenebrionis]